MKKLRGVRSALIFILLFAGIECRCQELSYRQLTVKDGLPGSIVYHSLQDRNGFIWFATNQGVSRFDGRTFRNFSKEDGLPDNDIVKLYLDKYNNIWFISLLGIPSVFYRNTIIRFDSCEGVRAISEDALTNSIVMVKLTFSRGTCGYYTSVNKPGKWSFRVEDYPIGGFHDHLILRASAPQKINAYFSNSDDSTQNLILRKGQAERKYNFGISINHAWMAFNWHQTTCISSDQQGLFLATIDSLYYADINRIRPLLKLTDLGIDETKYNDINALFSENDSSLWICSRSKGLIHIKDCLAPNRSVEYYFDNSFCTSFAKDQENGYWLTTHSDGVYYLPNLCFHSMSAFPDLAAKSVRCIRPIGRQQIAAGFSNGNIMLINTVRPDVRLSGSWLVHNKNNRIMDIGPFAHNELLVGSDAGLYRIPERGESKVLMRLISIKEIYLPTDSTIIAATSLGIRIGTPDGKKGRANSWIRATCVTGFNETYYYWGSLFGVYLTRGDSTFNIGKKYPALAGVINHIDIAPDSSIWVSTGQGIVILKNDETTQLTKEQGLSSNLCKNISFDKNTCWISTDKGISRMDYRWEKGRLQYSLSNITEEDGLTANDVNQTVPSGNYIWAATSRGISFFPKEYISQSVWQPLINITRIVGGDSVLAFKDTISLAPKKTRLLIELSGISFRSGKSVSYEYSLKGLDSSWRTITSNSIEFPELPFGDYTLQVRAIDRWGKRSRNTRMIYIRHPPPFWQATWFILSTYLLMALLAGVGVYIFHRNRRHKREKDYQLKKKVQDLEMMALRAQMDPHFIFNCLTSIQFHIMKADTKSASAYLHKFSTLIRQTLQNSTQQMILLRDEIRLLELYLDLEKLRLEERMDYRIELSPELEPDHQLIPPMIVQPYVENAIKHGIGPLEGIKGMIIIGFKKAGVCIECTIDDNGAGMSASRHNPSLDNSHRSMGTSITEKRIHTLNALQKEKIHISITDKRASGLDTNGTLIQLYFPISSN